MEQLFSVVNDYTSIISITQRQNLPSYRRNHAYMIEISNGFSGKLHWDLESGLPVTSKAKMEGHGYGLSNIRKVAAKYTGDIAIDIKTNENIIILPCIFHCILKCVVQNHADAKRIDARTCRIIEFGTELYFFLLCLTFPFQQDDVRHRISAPDFACRPGKGSFQVRAVLPRLIRLVAA